MKKIAFVTGGTGGIGSAICREFSQVGITTIAGYYNGGNHEKAKKWQEQQIAQGFDVDIAFGEITSIESCRACVEGVLKKHGNIDILINNAGITNDATFRMMSIEQWHSVIAVNLDSVFVMTKLVIESMAAKNWGRIINISSVNAQRGTFGQSNYAAAKSGIHGFTKALALEVARHGITVNTISPGYIETKLTKNIPENVRADILRDIPIGRFGQPEEVAKLVNFLVSDDAAFITGGNFPINGGHYMI